MYNYSKLAEGPGVAREKENLKKFNWKKITLKINLIFLPMSPQGYPPVYTKNVSPFRTAVCSPREGTYECFLLYRLYTVINEKKIIK